MSQFLPLSSFLQDCVLKKLYGQITSPEGVECSGCNGRSKPSYKKKEINKQLNCSPETSLLSHREPQSWPDLAALRGMCSSLFRLQSMAPETQRPFQILRDQCILSGSAIFRPLNVSLYVLLGVKEVQKLDRTIGLRY